tara:strand:+ start:650 stop:790 length:141 start_codon:yes stop_codon:yes gene_type:complete
MSGVHIQLAKVKKELKELRTWKEFISDFVRAYEGDYLREALLEWIE